MQVAILSWGHADVFPVMLRYFQWQQFLHVHQGFLKLYPCDHVLTKWTSSKFKIFYKTNKEATSCLASRLMLG